MVEGLIMAIIIALIPSIYRLDHAIMGEILETIVTTGPANWHSILVSSSHKLFNCLFGSNVW